MGAPLISLALLVVGSIPLALVFVAAFLVGGFGNGLRNTAVRNTIHHFVPEDQQGQVWAYYGAVANVCVTLGYLLGTPWGVLASRTIVILSGVIPLAATLAGPLVHSRTTRRREAKPIAS